MKIALMLGLNKEETAFARQVGVEHAVWSGPDSPKGYLGYGELMNAVEFFETEGLHLGVIENVPVNFYDKIMFGLPGKEKQVENMCLTIQNMGRAGIPVFGYHWMALGGTTTDMIRGRGGALMRHFDLEAALNNPAPSLCWRRSDTPDQPIHLPDVEVSTEQMWDNLAFFLEKVIPVAEESGVKLAAHPDDAPFPMFMGVARILSSLEDFERLFRLYPSPANGMDFCQGTISEMAGVDVLEAIRHFGSMGKIHFAHFRDTQGTMPVFTEVFMDEGDLDMFAAIRAYREVNYDGLIRADHTPHVIGDNEYAHRGFGYEIGYMQGLIQAAESLTSK